MMKKTIARKYFNAEGLSACCYKQTEDEWLLHSGVCEGLLSSLK
jgi:hypothetical protein